MSPELITSMKSARAVVVLTGAGISAESGIPTFRDALSGYWAKFDPMQLATPEAFARNPEMVTRWYDERRLQCGSAKPNPGHAAIALWQKWMKEHHRTFCLVTQTVDRLHQQAGSTEVIELHGSLWVWRCTACAAEKEERGGPFREYPPPCACGGKRRPGVVWFGEILPEDAVREALAATDKCDLFFSVGTSGQVYPAAGLAAQAKLNGGKIVEINPTSTPLTPQADWVLSGKSGEILPPLVRAAFGDPGSPSVGEGLAKRSFPEVE